RVMWKKIMKFRFNFLYFFFINCGIELPEYNGPFIERNEQIYQQRHQSLSKNKWIRKPENILIIHETLKKIGYKQIFTEEILNRGFFIFEEEVFFKGSLKNKIFSVNNCFSKNICDSYSKKFVQRRKKEGNSDVTFLVIREVKEILIHNKTLPIRKKYYHPILSGLIKLEFANTKKSTAIAKNDFIFLVNNGFHQSAYNLLYERYDYQDVGLNTNELYKRLKRSKKNNLPWLLHDTTKSF
ncbi:hypothetical protein, partial [Leptospira borgpetersenii]